MIGRLKTVVLDCPDPPSLAEFYGALLGLRVIRRDDDWITLGGEDGATGLALQLAPDHQPPHWPDPARPQQVHLDVHVDDLDEGERATMALGATRLPDPPGADFRVFADPAGHPFCLVTD